jgi:hypothetical protein
MPGIPRHLHPAERARHTGRSKPASSATRTTPHSGEVGLRYARCAAGASWVVRGGDVRCGCGDVGREFEVDGDLDESVGAGGWGWVGSGGDVFGWVEWGRVADGAAGARALVVGGVRAGRGVYGGLSVGMAAHDVDDAAVDGGGGAERCRGDLFGEATWGWVRGVWLLERGIGGGCVSGVWVEV